MVTSCTKDLLFNGRLVIYQWRHGYRFSLDAVLLAGLTRLNRDDRIIDLGTGCGVVPLILACRGEGRRWVGVEVQPELVRIARENVDINGYGTRVEIVEMDFRQVSSRFPGGSFDLVVSNPPYHELGAGRVPSNPQRAVARHEIKGNVQDVFAAANHVLTANGRLAVVYPASRLDHIMSVADKTGIRAKRLTVIYTRPQRPAWLIHLECRKDGGKELRVEPPLTVYGENGSYTDAMRRLFEA